MKTPRTRAFTLIELMAASLIGSLIVTSALGVFAALDRSNTRFATRYDQTIDMERTYIAVQRALRTMVISPALGPNAGAVPTRLDLSHVPGPIKMRPPDWASSRVMVVGDERDQSQRLEVVVRDNPIPSPALQRLAERGVDCEVIDLRSLRPLDTELVLDSVRRTGRLVVADMAWPVGGVNAEICALAAEHAFDALRAPVARVSCPDTPTPSGYTLEAGFYPDKTDIERAVFGVMAKSK